MIYAITVNWERPSDTIACVESLLQSAVDGLQVVVVDNGSGDTSVAQIRAAFSNIEILQLPYNSGYAGGFNAGIRYALEQQASDVLIINNDTVIEQDAISSLLDAPYHVAVPKILFYDNHEYIWSAGALWRSFPPTVVMRGFGKRDDGSYDEMQSVTYATGCALLVRRDVFATVGVFDEQFVSYAEDYDFCYRVQQAGFSMGYVPTARVYHKVSLTLGEGSAEKWWFLGRNAVLFFRKEGRFSKPLLWCHLAWVTLREIVKGNGRRLSDFWHGVRDGLNVLHMNEFNDHQET